jgi:acid-sensing ion channel, other
MVTAVSQVCDLQLFSDIDPKNQTDCANCADYLSRMMGGFWNVIYNCAHMDVDVCYTFEEVVTEEGVCYTYNGLEIFRDKKGGKTGEWTLDGGYRSERNLTTVYPRRGTRNNFFVSLGIQKLMIDGLCKTGIQGTKVYLHMPNEAPQMSKNFFLVPFDKYVRVSVKPKVIITEPELRNLPVVKRQCYFVDERYLRFFRNYTQNNCEHECVANLTVSQCGCMIFYMPSELEV